MAQNFHSKTPFQVHVRPEWAQTNPPLKIPFYISLTDTSSISHKPLKDMEKIDETVWKQSSIVWDLTNAGFCHRNECISNCG